MAAALHFEVLGDCPHCRVESALVEVFEGRSILSGFGVPIEAHCRMCQAAWEGVTEPELPSVAAVPGRCPACKEPLAPDATETRRCAGCGLGAVLRPTRPATSLSTREAVVARLEAFAADEGTGTVEELLRDGFQGVTVDELCDRLARGEKIGTSFDVFQFLFGHATAGARPAEPAAAATAQRATMGREARDSSFGRDPRAILYPIVSVMCADGVIDPAEERFVSAFLEAEGQGPLEPDEIRVHRPVEVERHIPRARRREIVELMIQLASVDGHADTSELRLAKAYANAWGITEDELLVWIDRYQDAHVSSARRFLLKLKSFFFTPVPETATTGGS